MNKLICLYREGKPFFEKLSQYLSLAYRDGFIIRNAVILFSYLWCLCT